MPVSADRTARVVVVDNSAIREPVEVATRRPPERARELRRVTVFAAAWGSREFRELRSAAHEPGAVGQGPGGQLDGPKRRAAAVLVADCCHELQVRVLGGGNLDEVRFQLNDLPKRSQIPDRSAVTDTYAFAVPLELTMLLKGKFETLPVFAVWSRPACLLINYLRKPADSVLML